MNINKLHPLLLILLVIGQLCATSDGVPMGYGTGSAGQTGGDTGSAGSTGLEQESGNQTTG